MCGSKQLLSGLVLVDNYCLNKKTPTMETVVDRAQFQDWRRLSRRLSKTTGAIVHIEHFGAILRIGFAKFEFLFEVELLCSVLRAFSATRCQVPADEILVKSFQADSDTCCLVPKTQDNNTRQTSKATRKNMACQHRGDFDALELYTLKALKSVLNRSLNVLWTMPVPGHSCSDS